MIRLLLAIAILASVTIDAAHAATTVWVVRHAEKQDDGTKDPALSEAGRARAALLACMLDSEPIVAIYSTSYRRTRGTAQPVADAHGLEVIPYDPTDFTGLADRVRSRSGSVLIVGHSNTIVEIVQALGGSATGPVNESDYRRLYRLVIDPEEDAVTTGLVPFSETKE